MIQTLNKKQTKEARWFFDFSKSVSINISSS